MLNPVKKALKKLNSRLRAQSVSSKHEKKEKESKLTVVE